MSAPLALSTLWTPGTVHELRAIPDGRKAITSGYFDTAEGLADAAAGQVPASGSIYWTLNPTDPALLARTNNTLRHFATDTTTDRDIARREWLPLDLDAIRPKGIPSTDAEHAAAHAKAQEVSGYLREQGWPEPALMDSGNGAYVLYRIDLPNDDESRDLLKACLVALGGRFSDDVVKVDQSVFNAARIMRVPGTLNRKGAGTADRPHRPAMLWTAPGGVVSVEQLRELVRAASSTPAAESNPAASAPAPTLAASAGSAPFGPPSPDGGFDLAAFIERHLPDAREPKTSGGATTWVLPVCPFNEEHNRGEACLGQLSNGALFAKCQHESCVWGWKELREKFDPAARRRRPACPATSGDPAPGSVLPAPNDPVNAAAALAERLDTVDGVPVWKRWRGDWYRWSGTHWTPYPLESVNRWLMEQTRDAVYKDEYDGEKPWGATRARLGDLEAALGTAILNHDAEAEPDRALACRNGVVDLSTGQLEPHTPGRFVLHARPFDYDPSASAPRWEQFLSDVLPADQALLLQQWCGYLISGRTDAQKILFISGEKRSGKGTLGRVVVELIGAANTCAPTIGSLATQFGLAPLIGKSLALIGDARWKGIRDIGQAVERLKGISGEDSVTVPRKYQTDWTGTLGTRFMIMSNDEPSFSDASGALASRMLSLRTVQSFIGREDHGLTPALLAELPGVLNWSLAGLASLNAAGRFVEPQSSKEATEEIARASSPVLAWVEDECDFGPGAELALDDVYLTFRRWCERQQFGAIPSQPEFGKQLVSACGAHITTSRRRVQGVKVRFVAGLRVARLLRAVAGGVSA